MIQRFVDWLVYDVWGMDASTSLAGAVHFFFYDTIKILLLLFLISIIMGIVNAYFPVERLRNYLASRKLYGFQYFFCGFVRSHYPVLFLFVHPSVYGVCKRRDSFGRNVFLFDNLSVGKRSNRCYVYRNFGRSHNSDLCS